ncbi:mitochondrial ribosomal protein S18 [Cristinia sonorae]|uniref:Small ribosomal subunit protein bS18m n=1 Tax=Cristinia sonorae TaxID=1940300 RepID=A0A8K0UW90_9AGAR|nr:mitochondrial ribosomal protein S18 [Cristinia sonorae]
MSALSSLLRLSPRHAYPRPSLARRIQPRRNASDSQSPKAESLADVSGLFRQAGDVPSGEQGLAQKLTSKEYSRGPQRVSSATRYVMPFQHKIFVRPYDFTLKGRSPNKRYTKPQELGPSAKEAKQTDIFHKLEMDPVHEATNSHLMASFVTKMGKILTRAETNLTWKSQRRLGKAIRRARMIGIIPQLSRRPMKWFPTTKQ